MKKQLAIFFGFTLIALLLLSACGGNQNAPSGGGSGDSGDAPPGSTSYEDITCTVQSQKLPDLARPDDHIIGELEDYAVTVIVYNDFSCDGCLTIAQTLAKTLELYPDDVRLVFRYFPILGGNDNGVIAAKAAEAAGMQGKFWLMHDLLYTTRDQWRELDPQGLGEFIYEMVKELELNEEQFDLDLNSQEVTELIAQHYDEALNFATTAPVVLVEGTLTPPYITTVEDFLIWMETMMIPYGRHVKENQYTECPPMTISKKDSYTATLHTEKGDVVLALYPDVAPVTVNNFIFLAENDYYDNTPFYAVIEGFVAQAGDPSGTGWGTPGFFYDLEVSPDLTFERPYMLAMGNSGPGASNSQFFITFSPMTHLNGQHTIFGEVIDGVDVLKALSFRDPEKDALAPMGDLLLDVTIEQQ
jgi:cyclophilin family peptidyl-prolyl cis-trans isomerase/protein-disulfide isomerase